MMVEAKLLRKKLKNGLIVDKWDLVNIIEQQADKLAELEKQSEPSYFGLTNDHTWLSCDEKMYNKLKTTHRMKCYTTPQTKPLSDEEIEEIAKDFRDWEYLPFARAIEAKVRGQ